MKLIRRILLLITGGLLIYIAYISKYGNTLFDVFIILGLIIIGSILFFVTLNKEISAFKKQKGILNFTYSLIFIVMMLIAISKTYMINQNFNKPTLLKASCNEDLGAISIDFKKDNTYIFQNSSIMGSSYLYGNYSIKDNKITLNKNNIDNIIETNILEIKEVEIEYHDSTLKENQLLQVNKEGEVIDDYFIFRVVVDNRN